MKNDVCIEELCLEFEDELMEILTYLMFGGRNEAKQELGEIFMMEYNTVADMINSSIDDYNKAYKLINDGTIDYNRFIRSLFMPRLDKLNGEIRKNGIYKFPVTYDLDEKCNIVGWFRGNIKIYFKES